MEKKKLTFNCELITIKYRLHTAAVIHVFFICLILKSNETFNFWCFLPHFFHVGFLWIFMHNLSNVWNNLWNKLLIKSQKVCTYFVKQVYLRKSLFFWRNLPFVFRSHFGTIDIVHTADLKSRDRPRFLIKLGIKLLLMHLLEISIFSLNNDLVRLTEIMNNLVKDLKILSLKVIFKCLKLVQSFQKKFSVKYLYAQFLSALFIILVSLTMTTFSEKMLISTRCIHGFMSNLIKKSWTDSNANANLWSCILIA